MGVVLHCTGKDNPLNILAHGGQFVGCHAMADRLHVLFDDRAVVQLGGNEVGGGADQFHAAPVGLVVGLGALEAWKEGVVNVDDASGEPLTQGWGQDLHVARQHHEINVEFLDFLHHPLLLLGLGGGRDWQVQVFDIGGFGQLFLVRMIGNDQRNINRQLAEANPVEQVQKAVQMVRDHDEYPGPGVSPG